ncbi:MAG: SdiA-regulated domain-containing protein [Longimicrobiales bacterium]
MKSTHATTLLVAICLPVTAARPVAQTAGVLARYTLDRGAGHQFELPDDLHEISGLATSAQGLFFAHGDESAVVFELDPGTGQPIERFEVGEETATGDFEGIAIAGSRLFMATSAGGIIEFGAAADGARVPFFTHRGLPAEDCEVEGLEYDAATDSLLLACKAAHSKSLEDQLVVFAFSLDSMRPEVRPRVAIPIESLGGDIGKNLSPSGIAIHPTAGTIFVVAAREKMLVELTREGRPLGARRLPGRDHEQPEGIAFSPDGTLWIADEGGNGRATITRYAIATGSSRP